MKRLVTVVLILGAIAAFIAAIVIQPRSGHPVTPLMLDAANATAGRKISSLTANLGSNLRPQVVIFILPDCPCSEDYEPYTQELYQAYRTSADFVGVVVGDNQAASAWKQKHQTPFTVIGDPDLSIAHAYAAKRSAYTAVLLDGKTIHRLWPGYSAGMLNELGRLLAAECKRPVALLNTTAAPAKLTSGCFLAE